MDKVQIKHMVEIYQLKDSGQKRPNWNFVFFNLRSKVVDFLHVTQH